MATSNNDEEKRGRPQVEILEEDLEWAGDVKLMEGISWADLAVRYEERTGKEINKDTLRRRLTNDAPAYLIPARATAKHREKMRSTAEEYDLGTILLETARTRYFEYIVLHQRQMASLLDEDRDNFSSVDQSRMDQLYYDLQATGLRFNRLMGELEGGAVLGGPSLGDSKAVVEKVQLTLERMSVEGQVKLQEINERHRAEGRGHYRAIPQAIDVTTDVDDDEVE